LFGIVLEDIQQGYRQTSWCGPENGGVNTPNLIIPISFNREDHDRQLDGMGLGSSEVQLYVGSFWQGILAIGTYLP
jgi:hypothetical protein